MSTDDPTTEAPVDAEQPSNDNERSNNREARYRKQLREAEAERDALIERVTSLQRAEAERLAGEHLAKPGALWAAGTALADLVDEDGTLDPARVAAAAIQARETLGAAAPVRTPAPDMTQGSKGDISSSGDVWSGAFAPNH